jgi:Transposase IS116/IS110/IS902 family
MTAYRMIDAITVESRPLKADRQRFGQRQRGCRALVDSQYGIGGRLAVALWSELGDCQRFGRSEQVVRHSGLDVTVDASDRRRAGGFLSRQGPQTLRWALYGGSEERVASPQPRPRLLQRRQGASQRQAGHHRDGSQARPPLLPCAACGRPRRRLRAALTTPVEVDGRYCPPSHQGSRGQLPQPACPPASVLDGLQTLMRPRSHDRGGHPIRDVVADDAFVEHPGNAGRPRTIQPRPTASMHRPSGWSRSFVIALLRALHLDQRLRPGAGPGHPEAPI